MDNTCSKEGVHIHNIFTGLFCTQGCSGHACSPGRPGTPVHVGYVSMRKTIKQQSFAELFDMLWALVAVHAHLLCHPCHELL